MSQSRKRSDADKTREMLDLVRAKYDAQSSMSRSWVACEEVADGTGWGAGRFADVLAFAIWPSLKNVLIGYEVKASRADLKRELADLSKHQAIAQFCDEWWLVVWDETMLVDGIPEDWGIIVTQEVDGERELKVKRKAAKREPVAWDRNFIASLVRNAYDQSPRAAYVAQVAHASFQKGERHGENATKGEFDRAMRPILEAMYGRNSWNWPGEARDFKAVLKIVAERMTQQTLEPVRSA